MEKQCEKKGKNGIVELGKERFRNFEIMGLGIKQKRVIGKMSQSYLFFLILILLFFLINKIIIIKKS